MRSKHSDRWAIIILIIALVLQSLWLLYDLGVISLPFAKKRSHKGQQVAGTISKAENRLKRRALNSLVWENSAESEVVYYYDSLLTLPQSTAEVELEGGAQVFLSENTLVTIEPPEKSRDGEIRLKFIRGTLEARNTFAKARIESEVFTIDLKKNSSIELAQVGEKDFDVRLKSGEAEIQSAGESTRLSDNKILRIQGKELKALSVDETITWQKPPPKRVYTHRKTAPVKLAWQGQAQEMLIQTKESKPQQHQVENQEEKKVRLSIGSHRLLLKSEEKVSEPLDVQVWQAPQWHLVNPLPRDRYPYGKVNFMWTPVPGASGYVLRLKTIESFKDYPVQGNSFEIELEKDEDYEWSVWVKDKEGFNIPPPYRYKLYIRENPFAPPKLKAPKLRKASDPPPPSASWLQHLLLPLAHAQPQLAYEAVFTWEEVPGADIYVIEISETKDFRQTLVREQVQTKEFVWRVDEHQKQYFWRVAAGSSRGRLGVFSEPEPVKLQLAKEQPKPKVKVAPLPAKKPVKKVLAKPVAPKPKTREKPKPLVVKKPPLPVKKKRRTQPEKTQRWRGFWRGGYGSTQSQNQDRFKANFSGLKVFSISGQYEWRNSVDNWWLLGLEFGQNKFEPESASTLTGQEDLSFLQYELRASRRKNKSHWGWGLIAQGFPGTSRTSNTAITTKNEMAVGPIADVYWSTGTWSYRLYFGPLVGDSLYGAMASQQVTRTLLWNFHFGVEVEGRAMFGDNRQDLSGDAYLLLGLEF